MKINRIVGYLHMLMYDMYDEKYQLVRDSSIFNLENDEERRSLISFLNRHAHALFPLVGFAPRTTQGLKDLDQICDTDIKFFLGPFRGKYYFD